MEAVGLYHMVLEGVVFTAGQYALLEILDKDRLPGLYEGMELVLRDEKWHIGFGTRCLQRRAALRSPGRGRSSTRASAPRRCGRPSRPSGCCATLRRRMAAVR